MRYLIARQGAFWNLANWSLGGTEVYNKVETQSEFINYIEYFASQTPWRRMITAQDCEQWHGSNRRWISAANIPISRKLNFVQTAVLSKAYPRWGSSNIDNTTWQKTYINNEFALDSYGGFPIIGTEALWECQGRAEHPLSIIMGFLTGGAYTVFADWCFDDGVEGGRWGSIGRHWVPLKPLSEHLYSSNQIGLDCVGDEQLKNVADVVQTLEYWKMSSHNELAGPDNDVFCLAEPGKQYLLYLPAGGSIDLNLSGNKSTEYKAYWYDPTRGSSQTAFTVYGGNRSFSAPTASKWILVIELKGSKDT